MAGHRLTLRDQRPMAGSKEERQAFKEKLKSLHFGIVPGGARALSSKTMWDRDETIQAFPTREEVEDTRSDFRKQWPDLNETG
jgi:hypothetical protein